MSVPTESTENILHIDPDNQEAEVIVDDSTEGSVSEEDEFDAETDEDDITNDEAENRDNENIPSQLPLKFATDSHGHPRNSVATLQTTSQNPKRIPKTQPLQFARKFARDLQGISRRTLPPLLSAVSLSLCLSFRSPRLSLAGISRLSSPPYLSLCASPFAAHASVLPESPPLLTAVSLSLCLSFCSPRLSLAGVSPSPHRRISLSVPLLSDVSVSPDLILSTLSSPIHFDLGLLAESPSLNPSLAGSLSSRSSSSAVILAGLPPSLSRTGSMSGNDYSRYLSTGGKKTSGSKKSSGSTKSSSRHTNPGSSSSSQMAESLAVPNSQTQASPPAPAPAPAAPAPAPAAPAPAPAAPAPAPAAPAPAAAAPAPDPAADLASINMILASPGHDRLPHLHPDRPPNTLWFDDDVSVAASVRQIFERDFKEPHANWKQTPGDVVRRWFEFFTQMYHWDSGITSLVRNSFETKLKLQLTRQVSRWKNPESEVRSCNSRAARYSDPDGHGPSKHRSGQTSFRARARVIAEQTGCSIPDLLGVLEITKRNPDGSFVDGKSKQLYNDVTSKFQELSQAASDDPESTGSSGLSLMEKNKIYCEFAPRKKGRLYGVGSLNISLRSVPASFPSSSTRDQSLEKIIYDQSQKIESQGNEISKLYKIIRHFASKDSTVADILQSEDVSSASGDDDESDAI
ncbi:hypothetical protein Bca101_032193 [Brassica carinata]